MLCLENLVLLFFSALNWDQRVHSFSASVSFVQPQGFPLWVISPLLLATREETKIAIRINERIVTNQKVVVDELGDYFSTAGNAICGAQVTNLV